MPAELFSVQVQCPYCWELIDVVIDDAGEAQEYIEDCQVCCRPINFKVLQNSNQQIQVQVFSDDEM